MLVTTKSIANVVNVLLGRGGGWWCVCMCVYGEAHKECVSNLGTNTRKGGRGGERRESSGSMLTIQIFGHLRT